MADDSFSFEDATTASPKYPVVSPDLQKQRDSKAMELLQNEKEMGFDVDDEIAARKASPTGFPKEPAQPTDIFSKGLTQVSSPDNSFSFSDAKGDDGSFSFDDATGKTEHSKYVQNLIDQFDNIRKSYKDMGDMSISKGLDVATGVAKGLNQGLFGLAGSVERGLFPGVSDNFQIDKSDLAKKLGTPNNPAQSLGAQAVGLPFAPVTAGVELLPQQYQQNAQDTINILGLAIPGLKRSSADLEAAKASYLQRDLDSGRPTPETPPSPPASQNVGPSPTDSMIQTTPTGRLQTPDIQTQGSPEIGLGPSKGPTNAITPDPYDIFGKDQQIGLTPDALGTEEVGQNPFLRKESLTPDENGILRDRGLSADVQREAYDFPKQDDLLKEVNDHIADQMDRATPETQDSINAQQKALWEAQERHEINKESEVDAMWRPYEASVLVERLPALKEKLESGRGNNRETSTESRVTPNPDRQISSASPMGRQRGAVSFWDQRKAEQTKINEDSPRGYRLKNGQLIYTQRTDTGIEAKNRKGQTIGKMDLNPDRKSVEYVESHPNFRGLGVGDAMYRHLEAESKGEFKPSGNNSEDSLRWWYRAHPEKVDEVARELANKPGADVLPSRTDHNGQPLGENTQRFRKSIYDFAKAKQGGALNLDAFLPDWLFKKAEAHPLADEILNFERRSAAQWMKDTEGKINKKDADYQAGMSTGPWRAINKALKDPENGGNRIQLFINNSIQTALSDLHEANQAIKGPVEAFLKHYGIGSAKLFDFDTLKKDVSVALKLEGGKGWFDGKNYVPTIQQMTDAGMSPKSAQAWSNIYTLGDIMWDKIAKTATMTGMKIPPRVPAWVPHMFKGPYKVRIWKLNEAGEKEFVATYGEYSRKAAQNRIDAMKAGAEAKGYTVDLEEPSAGHTSAAEMFKGLWEAKDRMEQNQGIAALLQSMYESSAQGLVSNVLQRAHPTMLGHEFERLVNDPGFTKRDAKEALNSLHETFKDINGWYNRVRFVNEKLFPLDASGMFEGKPNALRNVQAWVQQYLEIPDRIGVEADRWIQDQMIKQGWDPQTVFKLGGRASSVFATAYLFGNVKYYLANRLQSVIAPGHLLAKQVIDGGKGSVIKAMITSSIDRAKAASFLDVPVLKKAEAKGFLDPTYIDELKIGRFKDPMAQYIERQTRTEAFLVGYHYYKQFMPESQAIEAAGKFTDEVSVNYHRSFGQFNLLARAPQAGRPLLLFSNFNNHMLGLVNHELQLALQAGKNPKTIAKAATAILAVQGTLAMTFGINGLPFMNNMQAFNEWLNKTFNVDWGTPQDWAHNWTKSDTFNHIAKYGLPSTLLDADISTSGQGASFQLPSAFASMAGNIKDLAIQSLKWMENPLTRTKESAWKIAKEFPPIYRSAAEHFIKGDWNKVFAGEPTKQPGKEGIHSYERDRSPRENILNSMGVNSIDQADYNRSSREFNRQSRDMGGKRSEALNSFAEQNHTREAVEQFLKYGGSPSSLSAELLRYKQEEGLTGKQREAKKAISGGTTAKRMFEIYNDTYGYGTQ
jgi:hypothetical protein